VKVLLECIQSLKESAAENARAIRLRLNERDRGSSESSPAAAPTSRAAATTSRPAAAPREDWGEPNQGVQVRLTADQPTWRADQTPTFRASIRNTGQREWSMFQTQVEWLVDVDGQRYQWGGDIEAKGSWLPPGRQYDNIIFKLTDTWRVSVWPAAAGAAHYVRPLSAAGRRGRSRGRQQRRRVRDRQQVTAARHRPGPIEARAPTEFTRRAAISGNPADVAHLIPMKACSEGSPQ
jgi:hypothetical protein